MKLNQIKLFMLGIMCILTIGCGEVTDEIEQRQEVVEDIPIIENQDLIEEEEDTVEEEPIQIEDTMSLLSVPYLEGVTVFENTNWGMSEEEVLDALGISVDECVIAVIWEDCISYSVRNYDWQGWYTTLTLYFDQSVLSNGEEVGFFCAHIYLEDVEILFENMRQTIIDLYGLEEWYQVPIEELDEAMAYTYAESWRIPTTDVEACVPFIEEVDNELAMLEDSILTNREAILEVLLFQEDGVGAQIVIGSRSVPVFTKVADDLSTREKSSTSIEDGLVKGEITSSLTFEETVWGMNLEEALVALGVSEETHEITYITEEEMTQCMISDYTWQGQVVDVELVFSHETLLLGEEMGLTFVEVDLDPSAISMAQVEELLDIVYGLTIADKLENGTSSHSGLSSWIVSSHQDKAYLPYLEEVITEVRALENADAMITYLGVHANLLYRSTPTLSFMMDGIAEAIYQQVSKRYIE